MAIIINFSELKSKHELKNLANMNLNKEQIISSSEILNYEDDFEWDSWDDNLNLNEDEIEVTVIDDNSIKI